MIWSLKKPHLLALLMAAFPADILCHPALCAPAEPQSAAPWRTYTNDRFGYQICYPVHIFTPQGEPASRDGQHFRASDGADLVVFGSFFPETLGEEISESQAQATGKKGKVSYRTVHSDWAVLSGDDGEKSEFYTKIFWKKHQFSVFNLTYPKAAKARYVPIIEHIVDCFYAGTVDY